MKVLMMGAYTMSIRNFMIQLCKPAMRLKLYAAVILVSLFFLHLPSASSSENGQEDFAATMTPSNMRGVSPYSPSRDSKRSKEYYLSAWGVDHMVAQRTASGNLIRFRYRVVDPARAKVLGDSHATPFMFGQRSKALLHIPVMEKVGQLRQTGQQEAGKDYWMVFSNKGDLVKVGDQVNVIIGTFHADGLQVE